MLCDHSNERSLGKRIHISSYNVCFSIGSNNSEILQQLIDYLPPDWRPIESPTTESSTEEGVYFVSFESESNHYLLFYQGNQILRSQRLKIVLEAFDSHIRLRIGVLVKDKLFVHAGVVGWKDKAIIIPGRSFSGKTTLVTALVKAGAHYYSDEYAVFDVNGFVHPYPRPLSVRHGEGLGIRRIPVEDIGGAVGTHPLPVGLIVSTQYQPEGTWAPQKISSGQAVLNLLDNTIAARLCPEFALKILSHVVSETCSIEGIRGEADKVSISLLNHQQFDKIR